MPAGVALQAGTSTMTRALSFCCRVTLVAGHDLRAENLPFEGTGESATGLEQKEINAFGHGSGPEAA